MPSKVNGNTVTFIEVSAHLNFKIQLSLNIFTIFLNSMTRILQNMLFEPASPCLRDEDVITEPATQVTERIFKLSLTHVSVI